MRAPPGFLAAAAAAAVAVAAAAERCILGRLQGQGWWQRGIRSNRQVACAIRSDPFHVSYRHPPHPFPAAAEAAKKAKAEGGEAVAAPTGDAAAAKDGSKDGGSGREASRDPSRSPAPGAREDKEGGREADKQEAAATKRVLANEQLCLAFRYLDKTGAGYIRCGMFYLGCFFFFNLAFDLAFRYLDKTGAGYIRRGTSGAGFATPLTLA